MTAASRTRIARDLVLDHALRTTRGLPEAVARDRFDQIASDLREQGTQADRAGMRSPDDALAEIERRSDPAGVVAAGFTGIGL